ncbi:hypothetical protein CARUB_v10016313mg [Capsella rubella]|uniref:TF-B3 domain-containing protein n=1 Tax=Capsella rubella TaxID=81985 RepID=R0I904_9BRAS|nr:B3 domain-containing protein At5g24050 [Capsella rubella]EOA32983.1 hypothetical protein CARUB_v10016313mg [Capsella rubella]
MSSMNLTASEKDMWSNFCILVDAAVMVSEDEQRCRKIVSHEEEESFKRIFCLVPRKTRSSLLKRRYKQQNLSKALIDLNEFPTDSETEQCFIASDFETKPLLNPSSEPCSSLLLLDYKTSEFEKTETKETLNPNSPCSLSLCLPDNKSRKRRAVQERKRSGGYKKAKVSPLSQTTKREVPEWLVEVMRDMNGAKDAKLIFEKTLFVTDVNPTQNRLSMPFNNLLRNDFLTPVESRIIDEDINNNKKIGVGAILVDQWSKKWGVMLKRWEMKKDSGRGSWNYNLICGWNDIVEANGLKDGDKITLWSFRCCGILCFAMEQSCSSLALCLC